MVETFLDLALSTSLSSNPCTQEEEKKAEAEREAREMKEQSCNKVQNSKLFRNAKRICRFSFNFYSSDLVYPACSWLQVCWTSKVISWADPPGLDGVLPAVEELRIT